MRSPKRKTAGKTTPREATPHELLKLLQDGLRRKRAIKIEFLAGAHPLEREVTAIEPGRAPDGSDALVIVDDGRTVPITTILSATIEDDQKITVGR
jgi:hypothetical protein